MPTPCFRWHPRARAFAGASQIAPGGERRGAILPATPAASALGALGATLGKSGFALGPLLPQNADRLSSAHFATFTGGSSGAPKAILRTQASWVHSFEANAVQFAYAPHDSIAVLGALSHSLSLYGALEGLHLGLAVHVLADLTVQEQAAQLRVQRCSVLYATPTQLRLLPRRARLPDVRLILCGGGPLTAQTRVHLHAICPQAAVRVFYGAAETSFITLADTLTPEGSVGRAYPGVDIEVRDKDRDGTGTIWVRSRYLFDSYLQGDSRHTRRADGWLTVGELGYLDNDGHLFLRGRAGRVATIADQTVYPEEIEARLATIDEITHCAVLTRSDPLRGRHLVVVIEGRKDQTLRGRIMDACITSGLHRPREVVFLDPFPLLTSGKPDLVEIAERTGACL
jgi:long-chain acyl-CoA synthetase